MTVFSVVFGVIAILMLGTMFVYIGSSILHWFFGIFEEVPKLTACIVLCIGFVGAVWLVIGKLFKLY